MNPSLSMVATISSTCRPSRVSIMISSSAPLAGTSRNMRRCDTSRILAPSCPRMVAIRAQDARPVVDLDAQIDDPVLALEFAIDHGGEDPRIDIAAAQDEADLAAAEMRGIGQHRREPGRTGAFGQRLLMCRDRPSPRVRCRDSPTRRTSSTYCLQMRDGPLGDVLDRDALGERASRRSARAGRASAWIHGWVELDLDAHHLDLRA